LRPAIDPLNQQTVNTEQVKQCKDIAAEQVSLQLGKILAFIAASTLLAPRGVFEMAKVSDNGTPIIVGNETMVN
jgi:hypothetical protein